MNKILEEVCETLLASALSSSFSVLVSAPDSKQSLGAVDLEYYDDTIEFSVYGRTGHPFGTSQSSGFRNSVSYRSRIVGRAPRLCTSSDMACTYRGVQNIHNSSGKSATSTTALEELLPRSLLLVRQALWRLEALDHCIISCFVKAFSFAARKHQLPDWRLQDMSPLAIWALWINWKLWTTKDTSL